MKRSIIVLLSLLAFVLPLLYLLLHYRTYREMRTIWQGRALNATLGKTARNIFVYGLLVSLGLVLSTMF
jgi:1,4-dihydroxy-2-naphthoate octaprenyltransferase